MSPCLDISYIWCPWPGYNAGGLRVEEMDGRKTTTRQYSEYSDFFLHNENQSTIKIQTYISGSSPKSYGAGDGRREPDSGLGYTKDYRLR